MFAKIAVTRGINKRIILTKYFKSINLYIVGVYMNKALNICCKREI